MIKVHGVSLSPFVRKVLLTLEYKGIDYELSPVFPGSDDPEFRKISPLGKIPVLEHDGFFIADSSCICRYLDNTFPEKSIYPESFQDDARASWLEEFADSRLVEALAGLFRQRFFRPKFLGKPAEEDKVKELLEVTIPSALDYIESITPNEGTLISGGVSIADISVVTCFLQAQYADFEVDGKQYPKIKRYLDIALDTDLVKNRLANEQKDLAKMMAG
ncbi:MAG: glutathione S-transferase family protein [Pseudomonadales bacterium]|nr:glutathione S-transferase family protein [Pseudomonadales bacterium]